MESLKENNLGKFLIIIAITSITLLIITLPHPFVGPNAWRDAQTFCVARNFVEENFHILQPRYDLRGTTDGRFPGEFPLQTSLTALVMFIFGTSTFVARTTNLILFVLTMMMIFFILKKFTKSSLAGFIGLSLYATNTVLSTQSISIMPETMCNFLAVTSIFAYLVISDKYMNFLTTLIFVMLAALVKPSGYMVVAFFWFVDFNLKDRIGIFKKVILTIIPLGMVFVWIKYTLQFEHYFYGVNFSHTHNYLRTIQDAINELSPPVVYFAFRKMMVQGFNIAGVLTLGAYFIKTLRERINPINIRGDNLFTLGLIGWVGLNFIFLLYAGKIQEYQVYYAAPVAIPAVLLIATLLSRLPKKLIVFFVLLQLTGQIYYISRYYYATIPQWEDARLERITDKFSTRDDLFLVYPVSSMDFKTMGRLGRRGLHVSSVKGIQDNMNDYMFFYTRKDNLNKEIQKLLPTSPIYVHKDHYFYKLE